MTGRVVRTKGGTLINGAIRHLDYLTLMFGHPVPTLNEHEFTTQSACIIYLRSYSQQVIDAFQLVCTKR
jgi:hypothetical protein